jgi:hypothetical protein
MHAHLSGELRYITTRIRSLDMGDHPMYLDVIPTVVCCATFM